MLSLTHYRNYGRLWRVYGRSVVRYGSLRKGANAIRTEWAYRRRKVNVSSHPYILFVEPLYYCNLACPLCDRERFSVSCCRNAQRNFRCSCSIACWMN